MKVGSPPASFTIKCKSLEQCKDVLNFLKRDIELKGGRYFEKTAPNEFQFGGDH